MNFVHTFGFKLFSDHLSSIELHEPAEVLATMSPISYGLCTKDREFREALENADYLVLDGVYFGLASILLNRKNIKKNQMKLKNQQIKNVKKFAKKMNLLKVNVFYLKHLEKE